VRWPELPLNVLAKFRRACDWPVSVGRLQAASESSCSRYHSWRRLSLETCRHRRCWHAPPASILSRPAAAAAAAAAAGWWRRLMRRRRVDTSNPTLAARRAPVLGGLHCSTLPAGVHRWTELIGPVRRRHRCRHRIFARCLSVHLRVCIHRSSQVGLAGTLLPVMRMRFLHFYLDEIISVIPASKLCQASCCAGDWVFV